MPTFLRSSDRTPAFTVFGKLPKRADYLRVNATHPVCTEFDDQLQRGMAHLGGTPGWEANYDASPAADFTWLSLDQRWALVGSMVPSRDESGRRYPLVAGLMIPADLIDAYGCLLPIAGEVFFNQLRQQLWDAVEEATEAYACREFLQSITETGNYGFLEVPLSQGILDTCMDASPASELAVPISKVNPGSTLSQALLNLVFYQDFLHRFGSPAVRQEIHLPLDSTPGKPPVHASAWLEFLTPPQSNSGVRLWNRTWFLSQGQGSASLRLYPGRPPEHLLAGLFGSVSESGSRLELGDEQRAWASHRLYAETAYAFDRFFSDPRWRMADLKVFLRDTGKRISAVHP